MKRLILFALMSGMMWAAAGAQNNIKPTRVYTYPMNDPILKGLSSIRCCAVIKNLEGDGKVLIAVTNYADKGHVHVFTPSATGNTLELVWTSPKVDTTPTMGGGASSPRNVLFADLDGDGKKELIFESANNGVYIFEWDGVKGSHNFGTKPSQLIGPGNLTGFTKNLGGNPYAEHMEVADVDGDGQDELVMAYKGATAAENKYMIISASGDWDTNEPGFSGFTMEFMKARPDLADNGLAGGSCNSMMVGNLNGGTTKEVILQAYYNKTITILRTTGANTYQLADAAGLQYVSLLDGVDGVGYFGGMAMDIDKDGRDEIYIPTSFGDTSNVGYVHMISYGNGESVAGIEMAKNVSTINFGSLSKAGLYGITTGDMDGNGKPNIYVTTPLLNAPILTAEFQGGDKKLASNWKTSVFYKGDTTIYSKLSIRDSLGRIDTTSRTVNLFWSSKPSAGMDIDGNGREDFVMPIQPWFDSADSIAITKFTWNTTAKSYDSTSYKVLNPKRYTLQILERNASTGVIEARYPEFITPDDYVLNQNYPNPFNPSTQITFTLPLAKKISVRVYDIAGKEVRTLIANEDYAKGSHSITWNGKDNNGSAVASGTYMCKLSGENIVKSLKMVLLK